VTAHSPTSVPATVRAVQVTALTGIDGLREGRIGAPADDDAVVIDVYSAGVAFPDLLMSRGVLGFADGTIPSVPANRLLLKNVDVRGVAWGSLIEDEPGYPAEQWRDLQRWMTAGHIRPVNGREFPLAAAARALAKLDTRSATGKITLTIRPEAAATVT
jgi:hypothetical protein